MRKKAGRLISSIMKLFIFVAIGGVFIYFIQDRMIFHHVMDHRSREFLQDLPEFHEVEFVAETGKTHHGVMRMHSNAVAPLVIYFGGNGEVSYQHMRSRQMLDMWQYFYGYHYLFLDYDGYGLNSGRTHYRNMYETALAAYEFALSHPYVDSSNIVVMGFSLGTSSAVYLAANRDVSGLILMAPYANGYDLYNSVLPIFRGPMRFLVRQKLPSDYYAPNVSSPVLVIASRADEIVPFSSAVSLADAFLVEVDFVELDGASHNGMFDNDKVLDSIHNFLSNRK